MKKLSKIKIFTACLCAAAIAVTSGVGVSLAARLKKTENYAAAQEYLARCDLIDAARDFRDALATGDAKAASRASGRAEAYLSRAGLEGCEYVYTLLRDVCAEKYGEEILDLLVIAAEKARDGDGGEALRQLVKPETSEPEVPEEETEDALSARILERLGKSGDDVAERRARAFCCPNAAFEECATDLSRSYKYSGDNVFISLDGESVRVTMYCFDRELDERYEISAEEAARTIESVIRNEKLRLAHDPEQSCEDGIYRFIYPSDSGEPSVIFEVYGDTGRLRKYDAVNYYAQIS